MATLRAVTTSDPVPVTDEEGVTTLLEEYEFSVTAEVTDDGHISIAGPRTFRVWNGDPASPETTPDHQREFLYRLSQFLPERAEFVVQAVGAEKCRYPAYAVEWVTRPGLVLHATLGEPRCPVTPPATLAEIEPFDPDQLAAPLAPGTDVDEQGTTASFDVESPGRFSAWDTATIRDVRDVLQQIMDRISDPVKVARLRWLCDALDAELPPPEGVRAIARYELGFGRHETADLGLTPAQAREELQQAILTADVEPELTVRMDAGIGHIDE